MAHSLEERIFLIKSYYGSESSITATLRKWSSHFKGRPKPAQNMVRCLVEKFEQTGSVLDAKVIDKRRTARSPELIVQLENELASDPTLSTRKLAQITGSSQSTVIRAIKNFLRSTRSQEVSLQNPNCASPL